MRLLDGSPPLRNEGKFEDRCVPADDDLPGSPTVGQGEQAWCRRTVRGEDLIELVERPFRIGWRHDVEAARLLRHTEEAATVRPSGNGP